MPHSSNILCRASLMAALCLTGSIGIAAAANAADPVVIEFNDGVITPQTVNLAAGQETTLVLRNSGASAAEFEIKQLKQEKVVAPGADLELTLPALPAGSYEFVEEFHEDQPSARGVIVVE